MSYLNPATEAGTRIALDMLRVWMEQPEPSATNYVYAVLNDPNGPGVPNIVIGQLYVGAVLVTALTQAGGAGTADEVIRKVGEILRGAV
jgi:hypothetical protein